MISFIKNHKLAAVLLIILIIVVSGKISSQSRMTSSAPLPASRLSEAVSDMAVGGGGGNMGGISAPSLYTSKVAPQADITDRMVISESHLSLLVKNVVETRKKILDYTAGLGGYMVNSTVSNPQDVPTATVIVRLPSKQLEPALDYFRALGIKVVSENLTGYDVTDQYVDIEKRITIYENTKAKFAEILTRATEISDITNLNQEIINIQSQIDSFRGQQEYYAKSAELAKLTIYLSTDEIALPYAPSETFRPAVIFKQAVRSLVGVLRVLAGLVIWLVVYAVIWVPLLLVARFIYRKMKINRGA